MHFDMVIFDEASQVSPGDAINCIYRGDALILAGDQKQLPPTSFFTASGPDDGDEWSEESDDTADFESVLDLAKSAGVFRSLTLRWHYRSRHEALIAFSNMSFYQGSLITFPGANANGPDVGIELFHVNGTYRRGTTRDNPAEAAKVAERVIHHFDTRPHRSLGVVTFSEGQAVAIETALRDVRRNRPDLDRFFDTASRLRGFFVKSLEAVQGDERDVLIFSVGYGPDENGKITMNFGPLNRQGGWRRLNVAITRAHHRNEVVSSLSAGDIPQSAPAEGVRTCAGISTTPNAAWQLSPSMSAPAEMPNRRSRNPLSRSSAPGATTSRRRSEPPDTASTWACATPPTRASTPSASNATDTSTTHPAQHGIVTGCASRSCAVSAGGCTASGVPPGTATATARNASSARP